MYLKDSLSHQVEKQNKKSLSHSKIVEVRRIWRGTPEIIFMILLHSDLSTLNYQKQNLSHSLTSPHHTTWVAQTNTTNHSIQPNPNFPNFLKFPTKTSPLQQFPFLKICGAVAVAVAAVVVVVISIGEGRRNLNPEESLWSSLGLRSRTAIWGPTSICTPLSDGIPSFAMPIFSMRMFLHFHGFKEFQFELFSTFFWSGMCSCFC